MKDNRKKHRIGRFFIHSVPHLSLIFSVFTLTILTIDRFNRAMTFIDNSLSKALMTVASALALANGIIGIYLSQKESDLMNDTEIRKNDPTEKK